MVRLFESTAQIKSQFRRYEAKGIHVDGVGYVLIRSDTHWFLTQPECPHAGANLASAHINDLHELVCPMHAFSFDLFSGDESRKRCRALKVYKVIDQNGELWADI